MSWALFVQRIRAHPGAVAAVAATIVLSTLVIGTLQVFSAAVADGAVTGTLAAASPDGRSITVTGSTTAGLEKMDAAVASAREELPGDATTYRWVVSASYGLRGRPETEHVQLAEVVGARGAADLVAGAWPTPSAGTEPIEVAVNEVTARDLGWSVGTTARMTDLITSDPGRRLRVSAIWRPADPGAEVWRDDPFGGAGVIRTDFTTFGPLIVAGGTLGGAVGDGATATWRLVPDLGGMTTATVGPARAAVERALTELDDAPALADARTVSALPDTLSRASDASRNSSTALLTPTVLLLMLALAAIGLAGKLVATLRERETVLLRARGTSTGQVALLSALEGLLVALPSAAVALLLGPVIAGLLPGVGSGSHGTGAQATTAVGIVSALALVALVVTATRVGRLRTSSGRARSPAPIRGFMASIGVDVVLLVLGAVGVLQLRQYHNTTTTDPIIVLAPTLLIAALCVLCLRALPAIARVAGRRAEATRGLPFAWGAWQVARRLRDQAGVVLLVLLAVAMGSLALTQQATTAAAVEDQAAYAAGAPLRVGPIVSLRDDPRLTDAYATLASTGAHADTTAQVMEAHRDTIGVGPLQDVTLLAVDARHAGAVMAARPDQLGGHTWSGLTASLVREPPRVRTIPLPGEPTRIALTGRVVHTSTPYPARRVQAHLTAVLRDASGRWFRVPLGTLSTDRTTTLQAPVAPRSSTTRDDHEALTGAAVQYPLSLVGITGIYDSPGSPFRRAAADNRTLTVRVREFDVSNSSDGPTTSVPGTTSLVWSEGRDGPATLLVPQSKEPLPVVLTAPVARAADVAEGDDFSLSHLGHEIPAVVTGVVDSLPSLEDPTSGILVDLGALQVGEALESTTPSTALTPIDPTEWWLAPDGPDTAAARDALAAQPALSASIVDRAQLVEQATDDPVAAGLRGAMELVSLAAVCLAAIGFAATTVTLGRLRRGESAVLTALGLSPRSLRRVLLVERIALVSLTTVVGVALGVIASWLTVPLLVTSTGRAAAPPVLVHLPWVDLVVLGVGLVALLSVVAMLVVRSLPRAEVTGTLRAGGHE